MRLIKLDAIDSTNDFLKAIASKEETSDYTVVTAENQTKGKGQMGAVWNSEIGKNLIMSVLVKKALNVSEEIFILNIAVALAVLEVLKQNEIPDLSVKWPNDIMSANKKIGGILIENSFKSDGSIESVIGLGLNVNQSDFENLPKASSLANVTQQFFDKEVLLLQIVESIKAHVKTLKQNPKLLWNDYEHSLFRKELPTAFETKTGDRFMGIIKGVDTDGKLKIQLENDSIQTYEIKQIQMFY